MVAKEFLNYNKNNGVLFLSHFAGVSVELEGPVLYNPFNKNDSVNKLLKIILNKIDKIPSKMNKIPSLTNLEDWVKIHTKK